MLNQDLYSYTPAQVILKLKPDWTLDPEDDGEDVSQQPSNINGNSITFKSLQRVGDLLTPMSQEFTFDKIITESGSGAAANCTTITTQQQEIDDLITYPVINELLQGISTVIMTYGQAESGKTYTLFGGDNNNNNNNSINTNTNTKTAGSSALKPMIANLCETLYSRLPRDKTCHITLSSIQIQGNKYYDSLDRETHVGSTLSSSSSSSTNLIPPQPRLIKKLEDRHEYPMFSLDDLLGSIYRVYSTERKQRHILIRISLQIIDTQMEYIQRSHLTFLDLTESSLQAQQSKDKLLHTLERVATALNVDGSLGSPVMTTTLDSFTSPSDTVTAVITTRKKSVNNTNTGSISPPPPLYPSAPNAATSISETTSILSSSTSANMGSTLNLGTGTGTNSTNSNDTHLHHFQRRQNHLLPNNIKLPPVLTETLAGKNKVILMLTASMQPVNSQATLKTLNFGTNFKALRNEIQIDKRPLDMEMELLQLHRDFESRFEYWERQRLALESELELFELHDSGSNPIVSGSGNDDPRLSLTDYTDEEAKLDLKLQLKEDETLNLQNQINSLKNLLVSSTTLSLKNSGTGNDTEAIFDLLDALSNKVRDQYVLQTDLEATKIETDVLSALLRKKAEHIEYLDSLNAELRQTIEDQEDLYKKLMETNINLNLQLQELNDKIALDRRQIDSIVKRSAATGCLNGLYSPFHQYIISSPTTSPQHNMNINNSNQVPSSQNRKRGSLSSNDSRSSTSSSLWTNPELLDDFTSSDRSYRTQLTAVSPHSLHISASTTAPSTTTTTTPSLSTGTTTTTQGSGSTAGLGFKPRGGFQLNVVKVTR